MDTPTSKKLDIIIPAYRMHSQSFKNALEGITEEAALKRIDNNTNHVVWMTGNLVNCRYWIGNMLGIEDKDPYEDLFKEGRALDENLRISHIGRANEKFRSHIAESISKIIIGNR